MNCIRAWTQAWAEPLEGRCLLAATPFTFGGPRFDSGYQVKADGDGNVVVAGIFSEQADFKPGSASLTLQSVGQSDGFVAKYTPAGKLIWAGRFGGGAGELSNKKLFSPIQQTVGELVNNSGAAPNGAGE